MTRKAIDIFRIALVVICAIATGFVGFDAGKNLPILEAILTGSLAFASAFVLGRLLLRMARLSWKGRESQMVEFAGVVLGAGITTWLLSQGGLGALIGSSLVIGLTLGAVPAIISPESITSDHKHKS